MQARIHTPFPLLWIPAFAGMTEWKYWIPAFAGMTEWKYWIPAVVYPSAEGRE
jgi:hypothetical protein